MVKMIVGVEGMACGMCESHINEAIRNAFPVDSVSSSRSKKETDIVAKDLIPEEKIRKVIDQTGYQVTSYRVEPYEKKKGFLAWLFG
ncbi:heavy-metal-associated domain-containing protein [Acidaminococcus sp. CAG:542]|jgi:copper chaperone CopZ|uniref:heavy-metal-associated domain-containing protein n=1 Tax=Acidaminococcus sp. CAG:542 TaxID=1262687 RepID=UPI0003357A0F|nr:heavy-metal-associated domain-containing protein [Acidaminococcus sp. CAG:542]CDE94006.1 heavy metal-associated domain protein [Acidaminococcus sp. CAG:542]